MLLTNKNSNSRIKITLNIKQRVDGHRSNGYKLGNRTLLKSDIFIQNQKTYFLYDFIENYLFY